MLDHLLNNYMIEHRQMKACEPRDLLDRVTDICLFEGHALELTPKILDTAWRNYFGTAHVYTPPAQTTAPLDAEFADPLQL
jgi:hypothetical protein